MKRLALLVVLALAGCDQHAHQESPPPVGRYQMVAISNGGGVYVLDTQGGNISLCTTTLGDQTWCTPRVKADEGMGSPAIGGAQ